MKRIIRLTESDLARIVRRVIREEDDDRCMDEDGNEVPCKHDGTDVRYSHHQDFPEVNVTAQRGNGIEIQLKKPQNGYDMLKYIPKTGELLGNGDIKRIIAKIQKDQTEEQVRQWLKRNNIKAYI